jgi:subtilisin family serine protease
MNPKLSLEKKKISLVIMLCVLFVLLNGVVQASSPTLQGVKPTPTVVSTQESPDIEKIAPAVQQAINSLQSDEMITVIVTLKAQANLAGIIDRNRRVRIEKVINALQNMANATQGRIKALLQDRQSQGKVSQFESFWVFNGLSVTATSDVIAEIAALPEVKTITPNATIQGPSPPAAGGSPEPNLSLVNAPALWDLGFRGQGIVVANMDTGVDLNHPDLSSQWRGGSNSWFDPNGEFPTTPTDVYGHGTWTMGVMVGRDAGGTAVGVAPEAQWIAVKIFNNQGNATVAGIHEGFQWLLDPDGNPGTDDAPHVVNNSWTFGSPGCDLEFQLDLISLRAAGIVPIFAAGNFGPSSGTSASPANNPEAFAVGATNNSDFIYSYSSRGPSACGEGQTTFPEMVAPGVSIHTTDLFGLYTNATGTSMAAPHIAGGLALLLSAYPDLLATEQETALFSGTVDLGPTGPDNDFGEGRLDILAAYQWLSDGGGSSPPTPTSTPTPTNTPVDTPTPTNTPTPVPPTATPTSEPQPVSFYLSLANSGSYDVGSAAGVSDEDILYFGGTDFALVFDGSDVDVGGLNLDAFTMVDADTILMSFDNAATIGSLGTVDGSDIVQFDATSLGDNTAGSFSLFFDGSDVGLDGKGENVDAIELLADGRLLISTDGNVSVPGLRGKQQDEDLLAFTHTSLGNDTSGSWSLYFDGSDVELTSNSDEDISGIAVVANDDIYLTTAGDFSVSGISGADEDIFVCTPTSLGDDTVCIYATTLLFDGSAWGLSDNNLDAIDAP